jgi:hypothetical protein
VLREDLPLRADLHRHPRNCAVFLSSRRTGEPCVAASTELDDRPGAVRDRLVELQRQWVDTLTTSFRKAMDEGHVAADADAEQPTARKILSASVWSLS